MDAGFVNSVITVINARRLELQQNCLENKVLKIRKAITMTDGEVIKLLLSIREKIVYQRDETECMLAIDSKINELGHRCINESLWLTLDPQLAFINRNFGP